ncbi:MAG: oligosaccharide flippase family protein, partial [Candidatus Aenigmatarchaeota archaeon]
MNYIVRILIARYFGPNDYGTISIGLAVYSAAVTVATLGLADGTTRWISKNLNKKRKIKGIIFSSLEISLPVSILLTFLLFFFSENVSLLLNEPGLVEILKILSFGIPFGVLTYISTSGIRGLQNTLYKVYSYDVSWPAFKVLFTGTIILIGYSLNEVAIAHVFSILITSLISIYLLQKIIPI